MEQDYKTLNTKFISMPVYEKKYVKAKVREFNSVIETNLLGGEMSRESVHYTCIACITIYFLIKVEKNNYPKVYLEQWNYRIKKIKMSESIDVELESDSSCHCE